MPKLYSSRHVVSVLERAGFQLVSQKGSHGKFKGSTDGMAHTVIIPLARREIPYGTFRSIARQAGLSEDDFRR